MVKFFNFHKISIFAISVIFCFNITVARGEKINSIVAVVNDEIITNFDVLRRTAAAMQHAEKVYDRTQLEGKKLEFYEEALKELINREVLVQTAQKALLNDEIKIDEIEKDLDQFIKKAADDVGSLSKFYEIVAEQGIDPLEKKRELRDDLMVEKLLNNNVFRKIAVKPKESKNYYNNHPDQYYTETKVRFRQILIKFSEYENKEYAKLEADKIMGELRLGKNFAELAKKYSHGSHSKNGGLWTPIDGSEIRSDLREIIYNMGEQEVSSITETSTGYHIILCEEKVEGSYVSFREVQDEIYQKIYREKSGKKKREYLETLKKDFFIKKY